MTNKPFRTEDGVISPIFEQAGWIRFWPPNDAPPCILENLLSSSMSFKFVYYNRIWDEGPECGADIFDESRPASETIFLMSDRCRNDFNMGREETSDPDHSYDCVGILWK